MDIHCNVDLKSKTWRQAKFPSVKDWLSTSLVDIFKQGKKLCRHRTAAAIHTVQLQWLEKNKIKCLLQKAENIVLLKKPPQILLSQRKYVK